LTANNFIKGEKMNIYLIWLLRIVHIVAGVIWVGGTLMMTFFVAPTVNATGEAGQKFAGHLMGNLKFSQRMAAAAGLTILAGALLYWNDMSGSPLWAGSGAGRAFGIGAAFAIIGFVFGIMIGRTTRAMAQLGAQFQGKPSDEQMAQIQKMQKQQVTYSYTASTTLVIALIFMAIARYFVF
jgi:uncharacterized membrane protein